MPLYDYHCEKCQTESELLISSSTVAVCPSCGSEQMQRLVSAPVPPGRSKKLVQGWRAQAAKEGHFSNYKRSEMPKR